MQVSRRTWLLALATAAVALGALAWLLAPRFAAIAERTTSTLSTAYHAGAMAQRLLDDTPDHVLVLFQNSTELRPTGGFVTALGEGTIVHGRLSELHVVASDAFDKQQNLTPPLPEPMRGWISTPYLTLRDANWDPDFPTAAATVERLYTDATGRVPDVVLAITTSATEALVRATGPVSFSVNGHAITVDASNVTDTLENLTDVDFATLSLTKANRKEVLVQFAQALLPKVQLYASQDPGGALQLLSQLTERYDLQAWSNDPGLDSHLAGLSARREVDAATGDALLVVDTNLNAYKTDPYVQRTATYDVVLDGPGGAAQATLTLTYRNTSSTAQRLTTTYNDYMRVYVPFGSLLQHATGLAHVTPTQRHGRTVFGGMLIVPQGQARTITLTYTLGPSVGRSLSGYRLALERQAGSVPFTLTASVQAGDRAKTLSGTTDLDVLLR